MDRVYRQLQRHLTASAASYLHAIKQPKAAGYPYRQSAPRNCWV